MLEQIKWPPKKTEDLKCQVDVPHLQWSPPHGPGGAVLRRCTRNAAWKADGKPMCSNHAAYWLLGKFSDGKVTIR